MSNFHTSLLFQCDCTFAIEHESGFNCKNICSGVIATQHQPGQEVLYKWMPELWEKVMRQDQPFIMKRLEATKIPYYILDRRQFGNGTWLKGGAWKDGDWCLLHYNYLVSSSKRTALKENGHWIIEY